MRSTHPSNFGSFGGSVARHADSDGYVRYSERTLAAAHRQHERGEEIASPKYRVLVEAEVALGRWQRGERGGARPGAGRPPKSADGARVELSLTVSPAAKEALQQAALKAGVTRSELVDAWALTLR